MGERREFEAGPWKIVVTKSHILKSSCERGAPEGCQEGLDSCSVCRYDRELALPALPEMVFPENRLSLEHEGGYVLEFTALDALKRVDALHDSLKVAAADEWSKTRAAGLKEVKDVVKPFDWTYSTDYRGTVTSRGLAQLQVIETNQRIDYGKLRQQERIHFFDEVILYEDELADNGAAVLSVKIRVMATGLFILMRFFLRVDGVLVRLNDTRIYHQAGSNCFLREYTSKEAQITELQVPSTVLTDPNKLNDILPTKKLMIDRLVIPDQRHSSS